MIAMISALVIVVAFAAFAIHYTRKEDDREMQMSR